MTTLTTEPVAWFGCPKPDDCEDPGCTNPAHLPDRDTIWGRDEDDASWVEFDQRARRREDV